MNQTFNAEIIIIAMHAYSTNVKINPRIFQIHHLWFVSKHIDKIHRP